MKTVSVIIPAYNEENTIIFLLTLVQSGIDLVSNARFEVIVVDDGSTDNTHELLKNNPELYDALIHLEQNRGKGGAVLEGLKIATGDFVLFQDADLEYDPNDYSKLLKPIVDFNADLVIGSRFLAPEWTRIHYLGHKFANLFISFLFNCLNNTTFTDIYSCYAIYRRNLVSLNKIHSKGWQQHGEILSLVVRNGGVFYEVPISYSGRTYQEGKKIRGRHVISVIWCLIACRFRRL